MPAVIVPMKGVTVQIYRCETSDSSNEGVTSTKNAKGKTFVVFDPQITSGVYVLSDVIDNPRFVCLRLVRRPNIGVDGRVYIHAEPMTSTGGMFGGNFIYTPDSRLRQICDYPIPVHDRFE